MKNVQLVPCWPRGHLGVCGWWWAPAFPLRDTGHGVLPRSLVGTGWSPRLLAITSHLFSHAGPRPWSCRLTSSERQPHRPGPLRPELAGPGMAGGRAGAPCPADLSPVRRTLSGRAVCPAHHCPLPYLDPWLEALGTSHCGEPVPRYTVQALHSTPICSNLVPHPPALGQA